MARLRRLKVSGDDAYYHVMSRTIAQEFLLLDEEKDKFLSMVKDLSELFYIKIVGFSIMSNHFHLLIKMKDTSALSNEQILARLKGYYGRNLNLKETEIEKYRKKLGDLSEYMKVLKQGFSLWYNKKNNKKGHFWSDRFKSVLIESGESLLNCLAYIDLNPVRAKITDTPENYEWSSIGYRMEKKDIEFMTFEGALDNGNEEGLKKYLNFIYFAGDIPGKNFNETSPQRILSRYTLSKGIFSSRRPAFSDSIILGSSAFVSKSYTESEITSWNRTNRKPNSTEISQRIFSFRRKYEPATH